MPISASQADQYSLQSMTLPWQIPGSDTDQTVEGILQFPSGREVHFQHRNLKTDIRLIIDLNPATISGEIYLHNEPFRHKSSVMAFVVFSPLGLVLLNPFLMGISLWFPVLLIALVFISFGLWYYEDTVVSVAVSKKVKEEAEQILDELESLALASHRDLSVSVIAHHKDDNVSEDDSDDDEAFAEVSYHSKSYRELLKNRQDAKRTLEAELFKLEGMPEELASLTAELFWTDPVGEATPT